MSLAAELRRSGRDSWEADDPQSLRLPPTTELYLGLIHLTDGIAGARSRVETAKRLRPEFGVARDLHRQVAAL